MLRCFLSFTLLLTSFNFATAQDLFFPTFKEGLQRNGKSEKIYHKKFIQEKDALKNSGLKAQERLYREIYEKSVLKVLSNGNSENTTIPKVIHVIWIGSPFPEKYVEWQQTWKELDGWEYRLWTDKEVADLNLVNRDLYDASTNYGEKSDILRYEILYQFGGLYVDTDFVCYNPDYLEAFHHSLDFYIGVEPIEYFPFRIGNAIIGCAPQHPFMLDVLINLHESFVKYHGYSAVDKSGPSYMTREVAKYLALDAENKHKISVFPCSFFYPLTRNEIKHDFKNNFSSIRPKDVSLETCAIHMWEGSWSKNKIKKQ